MSGGFTLLTFDDLPALVYREDAHTGVFVTVPDTVEHARTAMASVQQQALSPAQSQVLIRDLAIELYPTDPLAELVDTTT